MKIALVGATGLVGQKMLSTLEERNIVVTELIPVATAKSVGKQVEFNGKKWTVTSAEDAIARKADVALFSAGGGTSLEWAPKFAAAGITVIDNSSAWRMDKSIPLIVPEINAGILSKTDKIIANPNCSTIQMVLALSGLHAKYSIKRLIISTYQSITGTGKAAVDQMFQERENKPVTKVYPYQIDLNCIPQCDVFEENGYTKEEMKLVNETRKILNDPTIGISATAVRVPVMGGHSESINVEFDSEFDLNDIIDILNSTDGVTVLDDTKKGIYPMPFYQKDTDDVFVGRIRIDESQKNTLNMWVVSDNLRKGAATNAVQILEYLIKNNLIG